MLKNLTGGTVINYGPSLPSTGISLDGSLFYKTTGDDQGLYVYSYKQDTDASAFGDQSAQVWVPAVPSGLKFDEQGALLSVNLRMANRGLTIYCNNYAQADKTWPMTFFNDADVIWQKNAAAGGTEFMRLSSAGVLTLAGNVVYHSGNSQLADVGKLNGQAGSYYQNAGNINAGTLAVERLPFMPVQQGGGANQQPNKIYIGWSTSALRLQVDSTDFANVWPISINGAADTANYANSAGSAVNANYAATAGAANTATTAGSAGSVPWTGVTNRPTNVSFFTNDSGYLTSPFPSGTRLLFQQTAAPVGWTKDVSHNDKALRVVSGAVTSGGITDFSAAFIGGTATVGNTTLTVAQLPPHDHPAPLFGRTGSDNNIGDAGGGSTYPNVRTGMTGGGQPHTHTIGINVKYVDIIIATKN